jgi:hypothetical protein
MEKSTISKKAAAIMRANTILKFTVEVVGLETHSSG